MRPSIDPYSADNPVTKRLLLLRQALVRDVLVNWLLASPLIARRVRRIGLRAWGVEVAADCDPFFGLRFTSNLVTFEHGSSARDCFFDNPGARVTIGRNARVGGGTAFLTRGHPIGSSHQRRHGHGDIDEAITVGEGCWIGYGVTVLGGVTIGTGCVIAAGCVVTRDCEPNGLYGGVPAKRIRDLD
jgi:maltose O-acetyltransferase